MQAKYDVPCRRCGRTILKGLPIEFIEIKGYWKPVHVRCPFRTKERTAPLAIPTERRVKSWRSRKPFYR